MATSRPTPSRAGLGSRRRRRVDPGRATLAQRLDPCPLGVGDCASFMSASVIVVASFVLVRAPRGRRLRRARTQASWRSQPMPGSMPVRRPGVDAAVGRPGGGEHQGAHAVGEGELDVRGVGGSRRPGPARIGTDCADHEGVAVRIDADDAGGIDEVRLGASGRRRRRNGRDRCRCGVVVGTRSPAAAKRRRSGCRRRRRGCRGWRPRRTRRRRSRRRCRLP